MINDRPTRLIVNLDALLRNYEITGNNSSLGNNAVVIGTNLNKDIIEKLFEN